MSVAVAEVEDEETPQNVSGALSCGVKWKMSPRGGEVSFIISTDNIKYMAKKIMKYAGCALGFLVCSHYFGPLIITAVKKVYGGERDDQDLGAIGPGSLRVLLHCFTDERFLEVLADYESGGIKHRLKKEFLQIGLELEGLTVAIENIEEVNEIKRAINKRYTINIDYFMADECVRFLFTSCERLLTNE